jgi:diguanylate cyclase (GGDEF)-like protein
VHFQSAKVPRGFRKDDIFFLTALATPAALAIENALLYSERKEAEEALKRSRDDLEIQVRERTAELTSANIKLEKLSVTDGLTGLYNYRHLMQAVESEYKRATRYNHNLSLLMIDIDYFKVLNDTYGHQCGDYVMKEIAKILKRNVRGSDLVARYGGDELAVILVETGKKSALEVAQKLEEEIQKCDFVWRGKTVDVKVSIGVAAAPSAKIKHPDSLLNAADRALYKAKRTGKNSVAVAFESRKRKT